MPDFSPAHNDAPQRGQGRRRVKVLFYSHDIDYGRLPLRFRFLAMLARITSPRFIRCTLQIDSTIYSVTRDGWRRTPLRWYAFHATETIETMADVDALTNDPTIPEAAELRSLTFFQVVFGYLHPRSMDHCSSAIGEILGVGRFRTPDGLYRVLTDAQAAPASAPGAQAGVLLSPASAGTEA